MLLTCTIVARNEKDRIAQAILSAQRVADEILVVDSGSSDGTQALAESLGARVIVHAWPGFGPQKRFAEDEARHDWILNLDADEWLTDALIAEITEIRRSDPPNSRAYRMRVRLVYPRRDRPGPFADHHNYVRLYNRRFARFRNSLAHDEVDGACDVVQLRGEIWHRSFRSCAHIVEKMLAYAELQQREGKRGAGRVRLATELPWQFFKYYVLRRHALGGFEGFMFALAFAAARWLRLARLAGW